MAPRLTFRDAGLQAAFDRDGYVVVPFVDRSRLDEIEAVYRRVESGIHEGFYASLHSPNADYKRTVDHELRRICDAPARALLLDYRTIVAAFAVKAPGVRSELPVHQDWNIVDESRFTSASIWFP